MYDTIQYNAIQITIQLYLEMYDSCRLSTLFLCGVLMFLCGVLVESSIKCPLSN
jgi:hypothetical protein